MTNQGVYIKSNITKSYNNVSRRQTQRSSVKKLNRIYRKTPVMGFFPVMLLPVGAAVLKNTLERRSLTTELKDSLKISFLILSEIKRTN